MSKKMYGATKLLILYLWLNTTFSAKNELAQGPILMKKYTSYSLTQPTMCAVEISLGSTEIQETIFTRHRSNALTNELTPEMGKLHAVFIMTNCEFALNMMHKMYVLIKDHPLFNNDECNKNFLQNLCSFQTNTETFYEIFEALYAHFKYRSEISRYDETGILKPMLSLLVKLIFIPFISDNKNVIRLILIDMNEIRTFLLMNCPEIRSSNTKTELFSTFYPKKFQPVLTNQLLFVTKTLLYHLNYLKSHDCVTIKTVLSFINTDNFTIDNDFHDITAAVVQISHGTKISVKDILKQMNINYDIHIVLLYYELIFTTVMQTIVKFIETISAHLTETSTIAKKISNLNFKFQNIQPDVVPSYITYGLEILNKCKQKMTSKNITNEERRRQINDLFSIYRNYTKIDVVKFDKPLDVTSLRNKILKLLPFLSHNISNIVCFDFLSKPVKASYDKYKRPLAENLQLILSTNNYSNNNLFEECDFVKAIFTVCRDAFHFMNEYINDLVFKDKNTLKRYRDKIEYAFHHVKHYFLLIMIKGTNNVEILKGAYKVSTILVNFSLDFERSLLHCEVKRILNVIMNEMNSFALKNCVTNHFDYLIFMNINVDPLVNSSKSNESITTFMKNRVDNFMPNDLEFENSINEIDYQFLNVQHLMDNYITRSFAYTEFSEKILFNWNGTVSTFKMIIDYEKNIIICIPANLYELYGAFFKFSTAVIFLRIKKILANNKYLSNIKTSFQVILNKLDEQSIWISDFPLELRGIFKSIYNSVLLFGWNKNKKKYFNQLSLRTLRKNVKCIENDFKKVDIYFEKPSCDDYENGSKRDCFFTTQDKNYYKPDDNHMSDIEFKKIFDELLTNAQSVYKNFKKLSNDPSNALYYENVMLASSPSYKGTDS